MSMARDCTQVDEAATGTYAPVSLLLYMLQEHCQALQSYRMQVCGILRIVDHSSGKTTAVLGG